MYEKKEFFYPSASGDTQIHALVYLPKNEIRAIVQIAHGMVEYIERYEEFADFLTSKGLLVTGNDHLGHGSSVTHKNRWGYFCEKNGNHVLLQDMYQLMTYTKKEYPGIPYFLLGHSMGSFYGRQFICEYGEHLHGAIIMGTGFPPLLTLKAGLFLCRFLAYNKGWEYRSSFVDHIAFGSYNKYFSPSETPKDWLTKDRKKVEEYLKEPRCNFTFTLNAYYNMFLGISRLHQKTFLKKAPSALPLLFVSGKEDPVGDFSKSVLSSVKSLRSIGMTNIITILYKNDRHEILNETDRDTVYLDILTWIEDQLKSPIIK